MSTVTTLKVLRQKLWQFAVLTKIEREHLSIDTEPVRHSLETIRCHVRPGPLMNQYLDRWDEIIRRQDLDSVRRIVQTDDEVSREMRNLSPLSVLLTEDERQRVLDEFGTQLRAMLRA